MMCSTVVRTAVDGQTSASHGCVGAIRYCPRAATIVAEATV